MSTPMSPADSKWQEVTAEAFANLPAPTHGPSAALVTRKVVVLMICILGSLLSYFCIGIIPELPLLLSNINFLANGYVAVWCMNQLFQIQLQAPVRLVHFSEFAQSAGTFKCTRLFLPDVEVIFTIGIISASAGYINWDKNKIAGTVLFAIGILSLVGLICMLLFKRKRKEVLVIENGKISFWGNQEKGPMLGKQIPIENLKIINTTIYYDYRKVIDRIKLQWSSNDFGYAEQNIVFPEEKEAYALLNILASCAGEIRFLDRDNSVRPV